MDDLEYMTTLNCTLFYFHYIIIKINHLCLLSISHLHTLKAFVPYGYALILSKVCNLLSSLPLSEILLISSATHKALHF